VLGVNTADIKNAVVDVLERNHVDFPNILDTSLKAQMTLMKYETQSGVSAVPMTYIIDREGKVMDAWYGYDKQKTKNAIRKLNLVGHQ
jgi:peroxiredoxin